MAYAKNKNAGLLPAADCVEKIVALYVRVSTGYQVDKDSLPHQIRELKGYCKHVLHIPDNRVMVFEDAGKSAKNTKRPAFERMMDMVRSNHVSHVIVYKIDRISRNLVDFSLMYDDFKKNRVAFISLNEQFDTSSAIGEAILKIILVFAELERKMTSERVTDIMIGRAEGKQWNGARVPYGYAWDDVAKWPVPHDTEAAVLQSMFDLYEKTKSSCKVRDYLNDNNITTKRGGVWTSKTVSDIIRNPMYKGTYRYNYRESARGQIKPREEWIVMDDVFTPLVSKEQWERCNKTMDANAASKNRAGNHPIKKHLHVFGGLLRCGACGCNMISDRDRARANGFTPSTYRCSAQYHKRICDAKYASDVVLGPFVFNYIRNVVKATKCARKIGTLEELESILLNGPDFNDIIGVDSEGLTSTYDLLKVKPGGHVGASYSPLPLLDAPDADNVTDGTAVLIREREKNEKALERLKKLYLFDDAAMSEKEYFETKQSIEVEMIRIDNELAGMQEKTPDVSEASIGFVVSASSFLLAHKLNCEEYIDYKNFAPLVDVGVLKEFINTVVDCIIVLDGRVDSIVFKNGLTHKFIRK